MPPKRTMPTNPASKGEIRTTIANLDRKIVHDNGPTEMIKEEVKLNWHDMSHDSAEVVPGTPREMGAGDSPANRRPYRHPWQWNNP